MSNPHASTSKTDLKVIIKATANGAGINYTLDIKDHGNNGKIALPRDSGPYRIKFELDTKLDLRFAAAAPFYCAKDRGSCPASLDTDQMMVDSCDKDELVVVDWNYGDEQELRYQVNFTDKCGAPREPLDPIIQNGGGIKPGFR
jgi:hypothetical protein